MAEQQETSSEGGGLRNIFIPIAKIDEQRREVWGYAALEEPDHSDEIMDYETSKPYWLRWSESAQKRSGGRSLGNVREMHKPLAAGKLIAFQPDDAQKGFWVGSQVVDDAAWRKVQTGVYTGFSVGGSYVKRWQDGAKPRLTRYTANPNEISLVDAPCIKGATFQVVKADGIEEQREFQSGEGEDVLFLDKVDLPESPTPTASIEVPTETVEKIPEQDKTMQISPGDPPDGETLTERHQGIENLEAAASAVALTETVAKVEGAAPEEVKSEAEETEESQEEAAEGEPEAVKKIHVKPRERSLASGQLSRLVKVCRSLPRMVKVVR